MSELLTCRELTKSFGNKPALDHLNLTLERGRIVGLLGPNGSGKTTLLKLINGLLVPSEGEVLIDGFRPGVETKRIVSYLPDRNYLGKHMRVNEAMTYYNTFYDNFDLGRASQMMDSLDIDPSSRLSSLSKGTLEKVQLILVMSREADLYILDEPIGGVDPAARDYILQTILTNYNENATVLISTHLISDIENVLDRAVFLQEGQLVLNASVDEIRSQHGKSVDALFREVFKC